MNNKRIEHEAPLTVREAAAYLGIKQSFLYKLTSQGRIPFYKPAGGKLYFTRNDLEGYLYRGRHSADYEIAASPDQPADGRACE